MENIEHQHFYGLLVQWPHGIVEPSHFVKCKGINFLGNIQNTRWEEYEYSCDKALLKEDQFNISGPYKYRIIIRRSGTRLLIMGPNRDIVEHFISSTLTLTVLPGLHSVSIAVDDFVKAIVKSPVDYVLSFVHVKVPAFEIGRASCRERV